MGTHKNTPTIVITDLYAVTHKSVGVFLFAFLYGVAHKSVYTFAVVFLCATLHKFVFTFSLVNLCATVYKSVLTHATQQFPYDPTQIYNVAKNRRNWPDLAVISLPVTHKSREANLARDLCAITHKNTTITIRPKFVWKPLQTTPLPKPRQLLTG